MTNWFGRLAIGFSIFAAPSTALASWDEAVNGDLSTNPGSPTAVTFLPGSNIVTGSVTSGAGADTRDYLTFTIPPGQQLTALWQMRWVDLPGGGLGNTGFNAINAGATSLIPDATNENSFLGGDHVNPLPIATDILPELSDGDTAGTGFSVPLGPGTYTYFIQQTGPQLNGYTLRFVISSTAAVPASNTWALALMASLLGMAGLFMARKRALRLASR